MSRLLTSLLLLLAPFPVRAEGAMGGGGSIVVVKRAGVTAYEEITAEFTDRCRVRARVLTLDDGNAAAIRAQLRRGDVVIAIGQRALDAMVGTPAHVISALALFVPKGVIPADAQPPPELVLNAIKWARPSVRRVGVVYGPRTEPMIEGMVGLARQHGIELVRIRAVDGPSAVRQLHRNAGEVDALWLAPDLDVLTPQLFQYALALEIRHAVPLVGVTRQQVKSGALLAIDADPHAIGRQAAELAHQLLSGTPPATVIAGPSSVNVELTVNGDVAARLGIDVRTLRAREARIEYQ